MEKDLIKFNEKIEFIGSKDIAQYKDEKGNIILLPISQLLVNCEYMELEEPKMKIAKFNGELDDTLTYNVIKKTVKKDKSEVTNKNSDKGTIIDTEVDASQVWFVRNGVKLTKSYNNKEEAEKYVIEWNNKILKQAELIK